MITYPLVDSFYPPLAEVAEVIYIKKINLQKPSSVYAEEASTCTKNCFVYRWNFGVILVTGEKFNFANSIQPHATAFCTHTSLVLY